MLKSPFCRVFNYVDTVGTIGAMESLSLALLIMFPTAGPVYRKLNSI